TDPNPPDADTASNRSANEPRQAAAPRAGPAARPGSPRPACPRPGEPPCYPTPLAETSGAAPARHTVRRVQRPSGEGRGGRSRPGSRDWEMIPQTQPILPARRWSTKSDRGRRGNDPGDSPAWICADLPRPTTVARLPSLAALP